MKLSRSPDLVYVASQNGLGHARRGAQICGFLRDSGIDAHLIIGSNQAQILGLGSHENIHVDLSSHGLEGPWSPASTSKPSRELLRIIRDARVRVVDNPLWPAHYVDEVHLFSHFTWLDFFENSSAFRAEPQVIADEMQVFDKVKAWLSFVDFRTRSNLLGGVSTVDLPFYYDLHIGEALPSVVDEIWISQGRTGDNYVEQTIAKVSSNKFRFHESFEIAAMRMAPELVIARPGMGTIRDCLQSATPLLALYSEDNFELSSNASKIEELGLGWSLPTGSPLQLPSAEELRRVRESLEAYRESNFVGFADFVNKLTKVLQL